MSELSEAAKKMRAKRKDYSTAGFSDKNKAKAAANKRWRKAKEKNEDKNSPTQEDMRPM